MGKSALGKGLGQLMNGQPVAQGTRPAAPASDPTVSGKVTPVDFGRGLNGLVANPPAEKEVPKARPLLPAWFFFAADVLLLAFTVAICFGADGVLQAGEIIFACVSTTLAAFLALCGVIRAAERTE